ncbi:MAG TPA: hypothetical protein VMU63_08390 [Acidimicrobiales bacterium]|nr:hypothetical protein [Acidimicrobiales bacterium]
MGRTVDVDQLVGAAEIVERLGQKHRTLVNDWRRRHPGFPPPVARLKMGQVWHWPDVKAWARRTGRVLLLAGVAVSTSGAVLGL